MQAQINLAATLADGNKVDFKGEVEGVITSPVVVPPPNPVPYHVLLNCINWRDLNNLPDEATEYTYFVLPVARDGRLIYGDEAKERKFIADVHAKGKKASFSIAGGAQNVADITNVLNYITPQKNLINNINQRLAWGYDGVTIDIENAPNINGWTMQNFINRLRSGIGVGPIVGIYTQPGRLYDTWSQIEKAWDAFDWLSPMIYDFANTVAEAKALTLKWLPKVKDRKQLLFGAAVNYEPGGQDLGEFTQILDWIKAEGLGGVGIWEHTIYTKPFRDLVKSKLNI